MLKVYLDSNIYSDISKADDWELVNAVKSHSECEILFLYSQAHLNDLSNDKTDNKFKELDLIEEIANTNFLQHDSQTGLITNSVVKANEAFKYFGEIQNNLGASLSTTFKETGDALVDSYLQLLKQNPIDLGLDIEKILSRDFPDGERSMLARIGITKRHFTMDEWVQVVSKMFDDFENDPDLLRDVRQQSKQLLKVEKLNININDVNFDMNLTKSKIGKSFKDLLDQQLSYYPDDQKSFYQEFVTGYTIINFLGFDSEANRKVRFKNTVNDAQHSYYGGTSDIIVSEDKGLLHKTRFLYSYYGFETKVMTKDEFKDFLKSYKPTKYISEIYLLEDLQKERNQSLIVSEKSPLIRLNLSQETRKLSHRFWGLFNYLVDIRSNENDDEYIVLYPHYSRTGNITYYKEVNHIIDSLNATFGTKFESLSDNDISNISNGTWKGLTWDTDITTYWLRFNFETRNLGLQIGPFKA